MTTHNFMIHTLGAVDLITEMAQMVTAKVFKSHLPEVLQVRWNSSVFRMQ